MTAMRTTALVALALAAMVAAGCGGASAKGPDPMRTAPDQGAGQQRRATSVSPQAVARALRTKTRDRVETASCQRETAATRARSPFGHSRLPVFTCNVRVRGESATYAVQVLPNKCFVAERLRPGRALYGCGVGS
jgi:hypothetical protein